MERFGDVVVRVEGRLVDVGLGWELDCGCVVGENRLSVGDLNLIGSSGRVRASGPEVDAGQ